MFASGEIQSWNYEQPKDEKSRKLSQMDNDEKYGKSTNKQYIAEEKVWEWYSFCLSIGLVLENNGFLL